MLLSTARQQRRVGTHRGRRVADRNQSCW